MAEWERVDATPLQNIDRTGSFTAMGWINPTLPTIDATYYGVAGNESSVFSVTWVSVAGHGLVRRRRA